MSSIIGDSVSFGGGSGNIASLSVTQNGTYTASGGVDGYSPVVVSVSGGGGDTGIITINSDGTQVTTSSAYATLEVGALYLFNTIYSGSSFAGCDVLLPLTTVYNATGYDRVFAIIRPTQARVTYGRYGSEDSNKYAKFALASGGEDVNARAIMGRANYTQVNGSFSAEQDQVYLFVTGAGMQGGTFTGANVICSNVIGGNGTTGKENVFYIIQATASTVQYSISGNCYLYAIYAGTYGDWGVAT